MQSANLWWSITTLIKKMLSPHWNTKCDFSDGISEKEFCLIANDACQSIKRVDLSTNGPLVIGEVLSRSKLNKWLFSISFNDNGHLTGKYWISTANRDSDIPRIIAEKMKASILLRLFPYNDSAG